MHSGLAVSFTLNSLKLMLEAKEGQKGESRLREKAAFKVDGPCRIVWIEEGKFFAVMDANYRVCLFFFKQIAATQPVVA